MVQHLLHRFSLIRLLTVAIPVALVLWLPGCGGGGSKSNSNNTTALGDIHAVNHIIYMLQENRSFDNYFGKLNDFRVSQGLGADVDGLTPDAGNPSFDGTTIIRPFRWQNTACHEQISP